MCNLILRFLIPALSISCSHELVASSISLVDEKQPRQTGFAHLPNDAQIKIIKLLDPVTSVSLSQVSKQSHLNVRAAVKQVQDTWPEDRASPALMALHLFHPASAWSLFEKVALLTPPKPTRDSWHRALADQIIAPQVVTDYVELVSNSPYLAKILCNNILMLDPVKEFRKVCLMARIVGHRNSEQLRSHLLRNISQVNDFTPKTVKQLKKVTKDPVNAIILQKHLMCAKLLTLSEDSAAQLDIISESMSSFSHLLLNEQEKYGDFVLNNPNQPQWICYYDNETYLDCYTWVLQYIWYELKKKRFNKTYSPDLLESVPAYIDYLTALYPSSEPFFLHLLFGIAADYFEQVEDQPKQLEYLKKIVFGVDDSSNSSLVHFCTQRVLVGDTVMIELLLHKKDVVWPWYQHLFKQMERHLNKADPDLPERPILLMSMAEVILAYADEVNYAKAAAYLTEVLNRFAPNEKILKVEWENYFQSTQQIKLEEVTTLLAALAIHTGHFDEALGWIVKSRGVLHINMPVICAIKMQMNNPGFPAKLDKIIGKNLADKNLNNYFNSSMAKNSGMSKSYATWIDNEFIRRFLKYHPIVRAELRRFMQKE